MTPFPDRLAAACREFGPVCVGLDPVAERVPRDVAGASELERVRRFSLGVVEAVRGVVPCVKVQFACFERYGAAGVAVLEEVAASSQAAGLLAIADAKRGDIGISAAHYAAGVFGTTQGGMPTEVGTPSERGLFDAVTVSPYLGMDGVEPFADAAAAAGGGVFVLVRTSNPGGDALQAASLSSGRTVAEYVAAQVAALGDLKAEYVGENGMSLMGAVVGATKPGEAATLRRLMPKQTFLVPGFGAQGGRAEDIRDLFHGDGGGALITASRSVLYPDDNGGGGDWQTRIERAARRLVEEVRGCEENTTADRR